MRVIAGEFRSRRLKSVPGLAVRPTPDRLREALFNVLSSFVEDKIFVDAYAGCGSVGIEALSRGARRAIFIEKSRAALQVLERNLQELDLRPRADIVRGAVATTVAQAGGDIVFLDPPYTNPSEYDAAIMAIGSAPALVIAQHDTHRDLATRYGRLVRYRVLKQGDNCLSFYRQEP
jgi:16S rRNA (guanine(966)-N(2))-methyltransferase RsmD